MGRPRVPQVVEDDMSAQMEPIEISPITQARFDALRRLFREWGDVAVALSGGVDSAFIAAAAVDALGAEHVLALTADSPAVPREDVEAARQAAASLGVRHMMLATDEFSQEDYLANEPDRCYHCKSTLYRFAEEAVAALGGWTIVNGANADDLGDYRPGLKAAAERGVRAPAAEVGLTKAEIRLLSRRLGLDTAEKPASPCLSSRVQYGERITPEKLSRIEQAERYLKSLGLAECRVRHHDNLARIEVPQRWLPLFAQPQWAAMIADRLKALGYAYVTLDLQGFRSGSMNEVILVELKKAPSG